MKFKWKLPVNFPFQKKHWLFLGYFLFLYCCDSGVPSYPTALLSVLVSHGFHNILLQAKWLKITQIYYFVVLELRSPAWISLGWNHSVESAIFLLEDLWKNLVFCLFHVPEDTCILGFKLPFIFKASSGLLSLSHLASLWHWLFCLPIPSFRNHCEYIEPTQTI